MHLVPQSRQKHPSISDQNPEPLALRVAALRVDFVAKPGSVADMEVTVSELIVDAELHREGLQSSVLLVSDRESRLVTLLTLWDAAKFESAKERLTAWTQRLIAVLADGPSRAYTGVAHFLDPRCSAKLTLADLRPDELAELADMANAD